MKRSKLLVFGVITALIFSLCGCFLSSAQIYAAEDPVNEWDEESLADDWEDEENWEDDEGDDEGNDWEDEDEKDDEGNDWEDEDEKDDEGNDWEDEEEDDWGDEEVYELITPDVKGTVISLGTQASNKKVSVKYGDSGKFVLDLESKTSVYAPYKDRIAYVRYEYGKNRNESLELNGNGTFQTGGLGENTILVTVFDKDKKVITELGEKAFLVVVDINMSRVKLKKKKFVDYVSSDESYPEKVFVTKVLGLPKNVDEETYGLGYSVSVSNEAMHVNTDFYGGEIHLYISGTGSTRVTVRINGKKFSISIKIKQVKLKGASSFYMTPRQTKALKVKNGTKAKWKSSNSKVVSVSKKGKIKARKAGNAVITAKVGSIYVGCVVSVVSAKRLKVVKRARYIGTHWTYSQAKRMQNKYYDCSALVWKAYKLENQHFGSGSYAPVAADVAKYCANHKKIVRGDGWKNIQKMKYNPGALTFKTGENNGRYKGIYHVEMFIGYTLEGFDSSGKPYLGTKWAAREDNYSFGELWAQP